MTTRIVFPEFREQLEDTKYPFAEKSSLTNDKGDRVLKDVFIDAALYPVGGKAGCYLSKVEISHEEAKLFIGDSEDVERASASLSITLPPSTVVFFDKYERAAGVLISEPQRLSAFGTWDTGVHVFSPEQTEFAATVCWPAPEQGVVGFQLSSGEVITGDVWLVGGEGVVIRRESTVEAEKCNEASSVKDIIKIDAVGDPLFKRQLCGDVNLFTTPNFIRNIEVRHRDGIFVVTPDEMGNVRLFGNDAISQEPVLRVRQTEEGLVFEAVGTPLI